MEQNARRPEQQLVRTPAHLRRFHPPSITSTASIPIINPQLVKQVTLIGPTRTDDRRQARKPSFRSRTLAKKFRNILLKEWIHGSEAPKIGRPLPLAQRSMRMKDSEDYLTARAANPRTGLISPSLPSCTPPPTSHTPSTPAEALELRLHGHTVSGGVNLPIPRGPRPPLPRANEGRRLEGSGEDKSHAISQRPAIHPSALPSGPRPATAPPNLSHARHRTALLASKLSRLRSPAPQKSEALIRPNETTQQDTFVLPIPSAREPQPYHFPGCTPQQIAAFEHYKSKARRTSEEGYGRRRMQRSRETSGMGNEGVEMSGMQSHLPSGTNNIVLLDSMDENGRSRTLRDGTQARGVEFQATIFPPYATPPRKDPPRLKHWAPSSSPPTRPIGPRQPPNAPAYADLRALPKVRLPHPNLAALPATHPLRRPPPTNTRVASQPSPQQQQPLYERRLLSTGDLPSPTQEPQPRSISSSAAAAAAAAGLAPASTRSFFLRPQSSTPNPAPTSDEPQPQPRPFDPFILLFTLFSALQRALAFISSLPLPTPPPIAPLRVLLAEQAPLAAKADALRVILAAAGQAVMFALILGVCYETWCALQRALAWLLWPVWWVGRGWRGGG